jgi:perosamine synthetase
MKREPGFRREGIGSRIPLCWRTLVGSPSGSFPWPPHPWVGLETGRAAIAWLLEALGLGPGDRALLPAYFCDAAVAPFRARGVARDFYRIGPDLTPDGPDACSRVTKSTRILVVVHYFGFPLSQDALDQLPGGPGVIRLEDWVQGGLSEGAYAPGSFGEYRVLAYHKVLPVPDSGLLVRRADVPAPPQAPALRGPRAAFFGRRLSAKAIKAIAVGLTGGVPRPLYRRLFDAAERAAGAGVPARMSGLSRRILNRTPAASIVARRRDNFLRLVDALSSEPRLSLLRKDVPLGVCPLGLPIRVAHRGAVLTYLIARRIYAEVHWPLPVEVDPLAFPEAAALSAEEITLPVDQRYGGEEMDFVARAVREAIRMTGDGEKQ